MNFDFVAMLEVVIFSAVALGFLWAVKYLDDYRTPFNEDDLIVAKCNMAVAIRKTGIYLAVAIGLYGVIHGPSRNFAYDLFSVFWESIFLLIALYLSFLVNDYLILRRVDNDQAVMQGNTAVGVVEFGSYIATGLITNAAFAGEGGGVFAAIVFFILGQISLVVAYFIYEWTVGCELCKEIEDNANIAANVSAAGVLISLAIILRASIIGPFTSWSHDISAFFISFLAGILLLGIYRIFVNWIFLPKTTFKKELAEGKNAAGMLVSTGVLIALSLVIASAM